MYCTLPNAYGIYHIYPGGEPSYLPDELYSLNLVSDSAASAKDSESALHPWWAKLGSSKSTKMPQKVYFAPYPNPSIYHLMTWFYNASTSKSLSDLDKLVENVILAPNFKKENFVGFRTSKEAECLDKASSLQSRFSAEDGWTETSIEISLPAEGVEHTSEAGAPKFQVPGLFYCQLLQVVRAALQETLMQHYHLFPYHKFWQPSPGSASEHIYLELYTCDAFLTEHNKIQSAQQGLGANSEIENAIVAITLWSDSTHLVSFGNMSL